MEQQHYRHHNPQQQIYNVTTINGVVIDDPKHPAEQQPNIDEQGFKKPSQQLYYNAVNNNNNNNNLNGAKKMMVGGQQPNHFGANGHIKPARSVTSMNRPIDSKTTYMAPPFNQPSNSQAMLSRKATNGSVQNISSSGGGSNSTRVFGSADMRSSYNERIRAANNYYVHDPSHQQHLYKSNGSLDLESGVEVEMMSSINRNPSVSSGVGVRRDFGSHGAIDSLYSNHVVHHRQYTTDESLDSTASSTGAPAAVSTLQRRDTSPKSDSKKKVNGAGSNKSQKGLFKKLRGHNNNSSKEQHQSDVSSGGEGSIGSISPEDRHRRRFFSHYDLGSVCASLSLSTHLRTLERRNTTTGASAASAALRNGSGAKGNAEEDLGDNISNELVLSCPYFRNEIGGEGERRIALSRQHCPDPPPTSDQMHMPNVARGFSLIDSPGENFWKTGICPYRNTRSNVIEKLDEGAHFYKKFFFGKDHQNWFGIDENLGAVAISIRREKLNPSWLGNTNFQTHSTLTSSLSLAQHHNSTNNNPIVNGHVPLASTVSNSFASMDSISVTNSDKEQFIYRILVRTSELRPLRGCVLEEAIPALKSEKIKTIPTKEVLEFVCPELQLSSLHLGIQSGPCEEALIRLDEAYVQNKYKVGLMYCREGQQTEEEMYNNEEGGAAFNEFLELIGQKVRLKGFNKYKAGLCNKSDSTGLYSLYTEHDDNEIMFHVSTLLPYTPNNRQQLPRKRYIGNDIVTVVFQEPGALPFIPNIKSQFQHVFIVVRVHNPCSENTQYSVAVTRSKSVPLFGPPLPPGGRFAKSKAFADFLLTKIINAETAAHKSDKFVSMAVRTRQELLKDLATNFVTQTTLDSGSKFSLFSKKKDKIRPRFSPDMSFLRGALSWRIVVEDCARASSKTTASSQKTPVVILPTELDAFLAISPDTLLIVQDNYHQDILFITSTKTIIGWTASQSSIRIYFHQGEALIIHSKDWETEDMTEISQRLKSVTNGVATQEFTLRRNQVGQLGFHVQHDGLITEVENFGYAWQTGLRQGSRLVEINKRPVTALSHEQMVELLKTSMTVTVTVIPPHPDGSPRKGCHLKNCPHAFGEPRGSPLDLEGDYENVNNENIINNSNAKAQVVTNAKTKQTFEHTAIRSVSPPRSTVSSGYGTGSSRKSVDQQRVVQLQPQMIPEQNEQEYGQASQRWYEFGSDQTPSSSNGNTPPPLPNRIGSGKSAFQKVVNSSSSAASSPSIYQHPPPPRTRASVKNGEIQNETVIQQQKAPGTTVRIGGGGGGPLEEKRSGEAKVTYLTEYELNQGANGNNYDSLVQHQRVSAISGGNAKSSYVIDGGHTTDSSTSSERPLRQKYHTIRSEDELSGSSRSGSPHRQPRQPPLGAPASLSGFPNSRNQSPKIDMQDHGPKKRQVARNANRNSANLASTTLQENLRKLIGPEFEEMSETHQTKTSQHHTTSVSVNNNSNRFNGNNTSSSPSSHSSVHKTSRENVLDSMSLKSNEDSTSVSYHTAIPATSVLSSSTDSSPTSSSSVKKDGEKQTNNENLLLTDDKRMDWSALVDTATKSIVPKSEANDMGVTVKERGKKMSSTVILNNDNDNIAETATLLRQRRKGSHEHDGASASPAPSSVCSTSSSASSACSSSASPPSTPLSPPNKKNKRKSNVNKNSASSNPVGIEELIARVNQLETRLNSESEQKSHLESEVAALRQENLRLQEESQTAAQQLKRFTEWFFQTIDRS